MNYAVFFSDKSLIVTFISSFLIWFMFGGLAILWIVDGRVKKEEALHALFSVTMAWVLTEIVKSLFPTVRPFRSEGIYPLTITIPNSASFPSSHSAVAFALSYSIYMHDKKIGKKFLALAVLVGLGRILSSVHTLLDVLVGAGFGYFSSYLLNKIHFFPLLKKK